MKNEQQSNLTPRDSLHAAGNEGNLGKQGQTTLPQRRKQTAVSDSNLSVHWLISRTA